MEKVKNEFTWDDREDISTFCPCDYCNAVREFPVCDDGATSAACGHCDYSVVLYCLSHNLI